MRHQTAHGKPHTDVDSTDRAKPFSGGSGPRLADDSRLRERIGDWACTSLADGLERFARRSESWEPERG